MQNIDASLYEAARIDGAGPWQQFVHITLPLLKPALLVVLIFRTLDAFRVFDLVFVLTGGGPGTATEPIALYTFNALLNNLRFGYGSALSVIIFLVTFLLAFSIIRVLGGNACRRAGNEAAGGLAVVTGVLVRRSPVPLLLGGRLVAHAREPAVRGRRWCRASWCSTTTGRCSTSATSGCRSATR